MALTAPAPYSPSSSDPEKNSSRAQPEDSFERQYLNLLRTVLRSNLLDKRSDKRSLIADDSDEPGCNGKERTGEPLVKYSPSANRTGIDSLRSFAQHISCDLTQGFPMLTTKKLHFASIAHELLWFIRGETNTRALNKNGISIWDEWADENGDLGPVYGAQWRRWQCADGKTTDQLSEVLRLIKEEPWSRRMVVNAWNVGELSDMALPPCHLLYQFFVDDNMLRCQVYQRSADLFLGVPFNIASYALLTHMVAHVTNLTPASVNLVFGDAHIYVNHLEQVRTQLGREPLGLPRLHIKKQTGRAGGLFDIEYEDLELEGYDPHAHINGDVAV